MKKDKTIYQLHEEHKTWLNKLNFYKDEITIMRNRIEEIAKKNTHAEVLGLVDHFENKLEIQHEQINSLASQALKHEFVLEEAAGFNPTNVDHQRFEDHAVQRDKMEYFEKDFNDLRKELIGFLSKWM